MATTITAGNATNGAIISPDNTGILELKTGTGAGTTAVTIGTTGNVNFPVLGQRITGDFSNATVANRVMFQTSSAGSNSVIAAIPNGAATQASFVAAGNSDPTNASIIQMLANGTTDTRLISTYFGTGTFLPMTFYTGGSERLRIDTSGNVGIGTSSPASIIHATKAGGSACYLQLAQTGVESWQIGMAASSTALAFLNSGAERMRIDSSGNVGIGNTDPSYRLDVRSGETVSGYAVRIRSNATATQARLQFTDSGATSENGWITVTDSDIMSFATGSTERARITSGGNFGVGTTTPGTSYSELVNFTATATNQPSLTLLNTNGSFANDVFQVRSANTSANGNSWNMITGWSSTTSLNFLVRGNGNVLNSNSSYGSLSDQRIKENIVDATPKLENLKQVRVVNFNLIGDEQKQIGVVAQELEQVFPGMVEEDSGGMKAVKYSVFVPMLIKAIQEQQAMIDELKAEVAALKGAA